ncbi:hypothetical protein A4X06_0g3626 [Tilletia controversa]|uniref:Uncharacterized protein n=1 Tax=Tilletia controversa TaxID=13291 RepID=A0A8X7SXL1_9BASI|nr:hypothetical protein CF328_g7110 [Tilletia controversa]KAE8248553.1 hypothetical protein A4X06_0g3626 [Tilletia controversa]
MPECAHTSEPVALSPTEILQLIKQDAFEFTLGYPKCRIGNIQPHCMKRHNCNAFEVHDNYDDDGEVKLGTLKQVEQQQREQQQRQQERQQREQQAQKPQQKQRQRHKQGQPAATPQPPVAAPPRYSSLKPVDMPFSSAAACRSSSANMIELTSPAKPSLKLGSSAFITSKSSSQIGHPIRQPADPASTQKMLDRRHFNSIRTVVVEAGGAVHMVPTLRSLARIYDRSEI